MLQAEAGRGVRVLAPYIKKVKKYHLDADDLVALGDGAAIYALVDYEDDHGYRVIFEGEVTLREDARFAGFYCISCEAGAFDLDLRPNGGDRLEMASGDGSIEFGIGFLTLYATAADAQSASEAKQQRVAELTSFLVGAVAEMAPNPLPLDPEDFAREGVAVVSRDNEMKIAIPARGRDLIARPSVHAPGQVLVEQRSQTTDALLPWPHTEERVISITAQELQVELDRILSAV